MADEESISGAESPLYKLTKDLLSVTQSMATISRADYLDRTNNEKKLAQEMSKQVIKDAKQDAYEQSQQGQEIQLSRDGQLFASQTVKTLKNMQGEENKKNTTDGGQATKNDVGGLKAVMEDMGESLREMTKRTKERAKTAIKDAKDAYEASGNLENLFETLKADSSLLLGSFQALTNIPFFNTAKVLLQVIAKAALATVKFLAVTMWNLLAGLYTWIVKGYWERRKARKELKKDRKKFEKKDGGDYRTKEGRGIRKREKDLKMRKAPWMKDKRTAPGRQDRMRRANMGRMKKMLDTVSRMWKLFQLAFGPKKWFILIAAVVGLGFMFKDWIKDWWQRMTTAISDAFFGDKEVNKAGGMDGLIKDADTWNPFQERSINIDKLADTSTEDIKKLLAKDGEWDRPALKAMLGELHKRGEDLTQLKDEGGISSYMGRDYVRLDPNWEREGKWKGLKRDDNIKPTTQRMNGVQGELLDIDASKGSGTGPGGLNIANNQNVINNNRGAPARTHSYSVDNQALFQFRPFGH